MPNSPILTGHKGFRVAGFSTRTSNPDEASGAGRIAALWKRAHEEHVHGRIAHALNAPVMVAVYTDYEDGAAGEYTLVVGAPVVKAGPDDAPGPSDVVFVEVPDGSFLLFEAIGPMPQALVDTWGRIHAYFAGDVPYTRSFLADFEIHDALEPARVEVYVGVG